MKVVERQNSPETTPTYTIVGAVVQSGVYSTGKQPFTVGKLIDAAGGLRPDAQPTLRVIRRGDVRFQIALPSNPSAAEDELMSGDIVVVASRTPERDAAGTTNVVPVACVGLVDRPVVLPLDPSITTVQELTRRLGQPAQVGQSARLITPNRHATPSHLIPGSVVFFDPQRIDRVPLQTPGFLPDLINLDEVRTSAFPGILPADAELPPDVPAAEIVQQASGDMITPPQLEFVAGTNPVQQSGRTVTPLEHQSLSVPPLQTSAELPQTASPASSQIPAELSQALELFSMDSAGPAPKVVQTLEAPAPAAQESRLVQTVNAAQASDSHTEVISLSSDQSISLDQTGAQTSPGSSSVATATTPSNRTPTISGPAGNLANKTAVSETTVGVTAAATAKTSSETTDSTAEGSSSQWGTFGHWVMTGAAISALAGIVLILSLVLFGPSGDTSSSPVPGLLNPPESIPSAAATETVSAPTKTTANTPLEELLNRSIPIVEEGVAIPESRPLHGKVVGHRKFIVNAAHAGPTGPHFGTLEKIPGRSKEDRNRRIVSEEHLRKSLRELIQPVSEQNASGNAAESLLGDHPDLVIKAESDRQASEDRTGHVSGSESSVVHPQPQQRASAEPPVSNPERGNGAPLAIMNEELDIVLPPSPLQQTSPKSPLERALRTLASEKRG